MKFLYLFILVGFSLIFPRSGTAEEIGTGLYSPSEADEGISNAFDGEDQRLQNSEYHITWGVEGGSDIVPANFDDEDLANLEKVLEALQLDKLPEGFKANVPGTLVLVLDKLQIGEVEIKLHARISSPKGFSKAFLEAFKDKFSTIVSMLWLRLSDTDKKLLTKAAKENIWVKFEKFEEVTVYVTVPEGTKLSLSVESGPQDDDGDQDPTQALTTVTEQAFEGATEESVNFDYPPNGNVYCEVENTADEVWKSLTISKITLGHTKVVKHINFPEPFPDLSERGRFIGNADDDSNRVECSFFMDANETVLEVEYENWSKEELKKIVDDAFKEQSEGPSSEAQREDLQGGLALESYGSLVQFLHSLPTYGNTFDNPYPRLSEDDNIYDEPYYYDVLPK